MTQFAIIDALSFVQSLVPIERTAAADGASADLGEYGSALCVIDAGAAGGTTPIFTFEVQESADDSVWTAVAAADLDGAEPAITAANDNEIHVISYQGTKRYVRVTLETVSGTSPTLDCGVTIIRGHARHKGGAAV